MQTYDAPLRDMRFVLHELFADDGFGGLKAHEEFTPDLLDAVLEEANKVAKDVLLPLNVSGDIEGCTYENGVVFSVGIPANVAPASVLGCHLGG